MQKENSRFTVLNFTKKFFLPEINGSSGLSFTSPLLHIISDNAEVLYAYNIETNEVSKTSFFSENHLLEVIPKADKPDYEAIATLNDKHYVFGSGSAPTRNYAIELNADYQFLQRISLENLYKKIQTKLNIQTEDFNIEGVILKENTAYFFNRGNGPNQKNGIIKVSDWLSEKANNFNYYPVVLPTINGFPSTFSDAVLVDDQVYFLATAEDTVSVYDDGEIAGSAIGRMSMSGFSIDSFEIVSKEYKLEGLTLKEQSESSLYFWLCDDSDSEDGGTRIFEMEIRH